MLKGRQITQTELPDPIRISLGGAWEADYWTHELGVSYGELRNIIGKVGNSVAAVRKELNLAPTPATTVVRRH